MQLKFVDVLIDAKIIAAVPVAKRPIAAGELLSADNVTLERKEKSDSFTTPQLEEIIGRTAARSLAPNAEIRLEALADPAEVIRNALPEIKSRDPVIVIAKVGNVQIVLNNALALTSGKQGELIRVRNETTQKVLTCRVIDANRAEVITR
jgi:flagella basal body P-ring formation protein FlgA